VWHLGLAVGPHKADVSSDDDCFVFSLLFDVSAEGSWASLCHIECVPACRKPLKQSVMAGSADDTPQVHMPIT
jgi:hypothetical protein